MKEKGNKNKDKEEMFKNMRLVILFDMFLNPNFKMTTSFANVARTTASTSTSLY